MKYYKIIVNSTFIGAVHSGLFVKENPKTHKLLFNNEIEGQYVSYEGKLYRSPWMKPTISDKEYIEANIIEITENEYNIYIQAIINNEIIEEPEEDINDIIIPQEPVNADEALEYIKDSKIQEMSHMCRQTIESGFDIELRGKSYHFSLTTQDQLNLMNLNIMAQTQQLIPYHADGDICEFYTVDEIHQIIASATTFKNYNIAYYNSLKAYINTLETIQNIAAITYGIEIPEEYKSDVLKVLEY